MAQLESQHEEIEAAGLRVVAIGLGKPEHAARFCGKLAPSLTCLTNEEPDLNHTYGLTQGGLLQLLSPSALRNGARAASKGFSQGQSTGDTRMLPGTFVVDTSGIIRYAYYSENAGDHPNITELLHSVARSGVA